MQYFANKGDFYRTIAEHVVEEIWVSHDAGVEKFGYMVRNFLAQKKVRGGPCTEKDQFIDEMSQWLFGEAQKQIDSTNPKVVRNGEFIKRLATELHEISQQYMWFSSEIVWES